MFHIGDIIIYSLYGLSKIDDICEKTVANVTRKYYVLHPLNQSSLTISAPVDNDKVVMLKMMNPEEAEEVLQSFKQPGVSWIEDSRQRYGKYQEIINTGNRKEIAKIANTFMRKKRELHLNDKKLHEQDRKLFEPIQTILFNELAMSLDTSIEKIAEQVNNMIKE